MLESRPPPKHQNTEHGKNIKIQMENRHRRKKLNSTLEDLPRYTGEKIGYRCPHCAYLKGYEDAMNEVEKLSKSLKENHE